MEPVKGLPVLVEAVRHLGVDGIKVTTLLVGSGGQAKEIANQAKRLGVHDRVRFVGSVPHAELADYYRAADLTVLPSLSEGVPNVLLESIACGTRFVASAVGGIPEIISPEHDRIIPPGDARALAEAIRERLESAVPASDRAFMPEDWPTAASRLINIIEPMLKMPEQQSSKSKVACLTPSAV
jgi:glycosyltransferase involved in cell wall biosynthesis